MARALPIFPLPLVLFPGAAQPLHIFEPRYRRLLADCLEGDHRFGIAYVAGNPPAIDPAPQPGDLGCVAVIESNEALPDGRANIVTRGERRFVLEAWIERDTPYRVAQVSEFDDEPEEPVEVSGLAAQVRVDFARVEEAVAVLTDRDRDESPLPSDPRDLSFHVAAALELEPEAKLQFLGLKSATARLRRLAALLGPLAADAERRAAVRRRAKGNGRGGPHAKIERMP